MNHDYISNDIAMRKNNSFNCKPYFPAHQIQSYLAGAMVTWLGQWTRLYVFISDLHLHRTSWLTAGIPGRVYFSWDRRTEQKQKLEFRSWCCHLCRVFVHEAALSTYCVQVNHQLWCQARSMPNRAHSIHSGRWISICHTISQQLCILGLGLRT